MEYELEDEVSITYFKQICDMMAVLKAERNVIWWFLQLKLSDGENPRLGMHGGE